MCFPFLLLRLHVRRGGDGVMNCEAKEQATDPFVRRFVVGGYDVLFPRCFLTLQIICGSHVSRSNEGQQISEAGDIVQFGQHGIAKHVVVRSSAMN